MYEQLTKITNGDKDRGASFCHNRKEARNRKVQGSDLRHLKPPLKSLCKAMDHLPRTLYVNQEQWNTRKRNTGRCPELKNLRPTTRFWAKNFKFLKISSLPFCIICVYTHTTTTTWGSEDNVQKLFLSFHHMGLGNRTQEYLSGLVAGILTC